MEIVKKQTTNVAIPDEFKDVFNLSGNMEGVVPRLPQIKIRHTEQMFEMPDETKEAKFEGVILDQHPANAWWEKDISLTGGGSLPDCFSLDGITPVPEDQCENRQNDKCADCKQNQFGSDPKTGKGKSCKNMKRVMILMESSLLPRRFTIPPTSIRSFESYMTTLVDRGLPYACVVTEFRLDKKISGTFEYAEVKLTMQKVLEQDDLRSVASFIKQYRDSARVQDIHADEYAGEVNKEDNTDFNYGVNAKDETPESDIPY